MNDKKKPSNKTPERFITDEKRSIESFEQISPPQTINQFFTTPKKPIDKTDGGKDNK